MIKWCSRSMIDGPYFALCTTEKDFHKAMKKMGIPVTDWPQHWHSPGANATTQYLDNSKGQLCCIVCMPTPDPNKVSPAQIVALLAHEAVHIKQRFMHWIGEDKPSDEFEAYTVQNIVQELVLAYPYEQK